MERQQRVASFLDEHDLETDPAYRVLDLASEVGELAKDVNESTSYGRDSGAQTISEDELGDALFCILALAVETDIDATDALDSALTKYQSRLETRAKPASGSHDS